MSVRQPLDTIALGYFKPWSTVRLVNGWACGLPDPSLGEPDLLREYEMAKADRSVAPPHLTFAELDVEKPEELVKFLQRYGPLEPDPFPVASVPETRGVRLPRNASKWVAIELKDFLAKQDEFLVCLKLRKLLETKPTRLAELRQTLVGARDSHRRFALALDRAIDAVHSPETEKPPSPETPPNKAEVAVVIRHQMEWRNDQSTFRKTRREFLNQLHDREVVAVAVRVLETTVTDRLLNVRSRFAADPNGGFRRSSFCTSLLDAFYLMFCRDAEEQRRVAQCAACKAFFTDSGLARAYCSARCSDRVRFARWYTKPKNRRALARRRRQHRDR